MIASYRTHFDDYLDYYYLSFLKKWIWKYMEWFHRPFEKVYVPSISTKEKLLAKELHPDIDIWGRGVDHNFYTPIKQSKDFLKNCITSVIKRLSCTLGVFHLKKY